MNLSEINWDINASGTWPAPVKGLVIAIVCVVVAAAGVYLDSLGQLDELAGLEKKELDLKTDFEGKQRKSANLQDYRDQLAQIETSLAIMIKQMPTQEEVASLLVDISQTGLASGLEFRLFQPGAPIAKEFYSELPIKIEVVGKYEELSLFVSGLAALPRIVTVHDVKITPVDKGKAGDTEDLMVMDATVKTYNEQQSAETKTPANKRKKGGK
ncbi:type 4a pilus biogenesis protein PilO [Methyloglobulus sp.]|uniref:type 4a pilus biogenesis protein PilO n=1 Tax=Methyloglobulus sp. TaxID=2518622 RepID=UPI0032B7C517